MRKALGTILLAAGLASGTQPPTALAQQAGGEDWTPEPQATEKTGRVAEGDLPVIAIGDITWFQIDAYCVFIREGHEFVYDDPDSWKFVLFTNFPELAESDPLERIFMRLDGALRQLDLVRLDRGDEADTRHYRSHDTLPFEVELTVASAGGGEEYTSYTGTIRAKRNGLAGETRYAGDCGV